MARFVYSPDYYCDIGPHVFRTDKYRLLHERMLADGLAGPDDFAEPQPASRADVELVHTPAYVDDLLAARVSERTVRSELPISRQIVDAFMLGAGGTMLACRTAVEEGTLTMNLAGGFHHAFPDWAEGFCYVNDVAVGVAALRRDGLVKRAAVIDCDLHQGNGTAFIFRDVPEVFTFSIHQENLYPVKQRSDLDVGLPDFCPADLYLSKLQQCVDRVLDDHRPEFVLYVAGADPYSGDQLGSLMLGIEDLKRRDEIVLGACAERGVPATAVLAGGYAVRVEDTVSIHYGTAQTIVELADG